MKSPSSVSVSRTHLNIHTANGGDKTPAPAFGFQRIHTRHNYRHFMMLSRKRGTNWKWPAIYLEILEINKKTKWWIKTIVLISKKKRKTHSLFLLYVHTYLNAVLTASLLNICRIFHVCSQPAPHPKRAPSDRRRGTDFPPQCHIPNTKRWESRKGKYAEMPRMR